MEAEARTTSKAHDVPHSSNYSILYIGIDMHLNSPTGTSEFSHYVRISSGSLYCYEIELLLELV